MPGMAKVFKNSKEKRTAEIEAFHKHDGDAASESQHAATGRPRTNKTEKMTIVMTPELKQKIKMYCTANQTTVADVFERVFQELLSKNV